MVMLLRHCSLLTQVRVQQSGEFTATIFTSAHSRNHARQWWRECLCEKSTTQGCSLRKGSWVCCGVKALVRGHSPCSVPANTFSFLPALCSCCTDQGCLKQTAWVKCSWNSRIFGFTKPCSWNRAASCGQGQAAAQTLMEISSAPSPDRSQPHCPVLHIPRIYPKRCLSGCNALPFVGELTESALIWSSSMFRDKLKKMPMLKLTFAGSVGLLKGSKAEPGVARQLCSAAGVEVSWNIPQEWGDWKHKQWVLKVS